MTPEQATFLLNDIYLPQIHNEHKITRKVIAAIPADQGAFKPDPKSMSALELAWHVVSSEQFFMNGIVAGRYERGGGAKPDSIQTPADVLKWDDENFGKAVAQLSALKANDLVRPVDFFGFLTLPALNFAGLMCSHSVHHRGQLSSYLRPMGGKVPSIYGPSGDEPMS